MFTALILAAGLSGTPSMASAQTDATTPPQELIWDTRLKKPLTLTEFATEQSNGDIVVFGEEHATSDNQTDPGIIIHHDNQVRLFEALTQVALQRKTHVNAAMEFLTYTFQADVNQFLAGTMTEPDFLKAVSWDEGNPFSFYSRQIEAPDQSGGKTFALNIPDTIANQVAENGPRSLDAADRALLPPLWEQGGPLYYQRFQAAMVGHATAQEMENFFWAQSLWDDTMAWNAVKGMKENPDSVTVIIVGEFHVQFGQGLPARLLRHGAQAEKVKTLLQVEAPDLNASTVSRLTAPDIHYGAQADYLWLHVLPAATATSRAAQY